MERPQYFQPDNNETTVAADHFIVEDLLDFSNDDGTFDNQTPTSTDSSSTLTLLHSSNSYPNLSNNGHDFNFDHSNFSNDLSVPYDELAELEWLSNFVEESFSTEDLEKLSLISGMNNNSRADDSSSKTGMNRVHPTDFRPEMSVPAKAARSKRSRAAPCIWKLSQTNNSCSETDVVVTAHPINGEKTGQKKEITQDDTSSERGRKCLHCATDKTPQWRTGPMGPKTLCNACGVRYKSGRLVPEYRPAASPTFVLTKHSNSHRKVMELRRQKEMMRSQPQFVDGESMGFDHVNNHDDYLIHQHIAPVFE